MQIGTYYIKITYIVTKEGKLKAVGELQKYEDIQESGGEIRVSQLVPENTSSDTLSAALALSGEDTESNLLALECLKQGAALYY